MTLSTTTSRVSYVGTGSTGPFAVPFAFQANADLRVTTRDSANAEHLLVLTTDYTVTGAGNATGTVTLVTALAVGSLIVIRRAPALTQGTSLRTAARFDASSHEDELDYVVMLAQHLQDQISRGFGVTETYDPSTLSLSLVPETGKVLTWQSLTQLGNSTLDSSAVALPGFSRTVTTLTAYLMNNAVYNVLDYAAVGDGATNDLVAFQAAWNAVKATGGVLRIPYKANGYALAGTIGTLAATDHDIWMDGDRSILLNTHATAPLIILNAGTAGTAPRLVTNGISFKASVAGQGVGIESTNTSNCVFYYSGFTNFAKGIRQINNNGWNENWHFISTAWSANDIAISQEWVAGSHSFSRQNFHSGCSINLSGAASATPVGISNGQNCSLYESTFTGLKMFVNVANGIGFYINGEPSTITGSIHFEDNVGAANTTAVKWGPNATLVDRADIVSDFRSVDVFFAYDAAFTGSPDSWKILNDNISRNATVRRAGKTITWRTLLLDNLTTELIKEQYLSTEVVQTLYADAVLRVQHLLASNTNRALPFLALFTTNAYANSAALFNAGSGTDNVQGLNSIILRHTAGATVTDFSNGVEGQLLIAHHENANCTLDGTTGTFTFVDGATTVVGFNGLHQIFLRWNSVWVELARAPDHRQGYPLGFGIGGAVTQATNKSTLVTLSKMSGAVTTNAAALAGGADVSFQVTNTLVLVDDEVCVWIKSGGTANAYRAAVSGVAAGSFQITLHNQTAGSLSEAPIIGFSVRRACVT